MYMKRLLAPTLAVTLLCGLSACDEGKITDVHLQVEPAASAERLTMTEKVQQRIFDAHCTACHGANGHAAANLFLTKEMSMEQLRLQPSKVVEDAMLMVPGNHAESLLYRTVATDISSPWAYTHTNLLNDSEKYLLATWIDLEN